MKIVSLLAKRQADNVCTSLRTIVNQSFDTLQIDSSHSLEITLYKGIDTLLNFILIAYLTIGCTNGKVSNDDLPSIDVTKNYPEKEIILTDIADVTYVHLDSQNEDYIYRGGVNYISENSIVVVDASSGSVLFFSKDGKPKSRFNHYGQGPEEYPYLLGMNVTYDETADDVFVHAYGLSDCMLVYSSTGKYKRKIPLPQNAESISLISFDDNSFFVNSRANVENIENWDGVTKLIPTSYFSTFYQLSKEDGTVLDSLKVPCNVTELISKVELGSYSITVDKIHFTHITKSSDGLFLCNPENDTIYLYAKDKSLTPVFHKTPLVQKTDPKVVINNWCEVDNYLFFEILTLQVGMRDKTKIVPNAFYVLEKKTNEIFRQKILLPDNKNKEFTLSQANINRTNVINEAFFELDLVELKQAYKENKLSGKLKELVGTLDELNDNNIFMIVDFK